MSTPDLQKIGAEVKDLGLLIGLLKGTPTAPEPNLPWFSETKDELTRAFNWPHLKPVAESFLSKGTNPIDNDGKLLNENWYPISIGGEKKDDKKGSGFYIVQKTVNKLALLGLGMHKQFKFRNDAVTIDPFVFAPAFQMPNEANTGEPLFATDKDGPIEIGFKLSADIERLKFLSCKSVLFWVTFDLKEGKITPEVQLLDRVQVTGRELPDLDPKSIINILLEIDGVKDFLKKKILADNATLTITWADLLKTLGWLVEKADGNYEVGEINIPDLPGKILAYVIETIKTAFNEFMKGSSEFVLLKSEPKEVLLTGDEDDDDEVEPTWQMSLIMDEGRYGINVQVADVVLKSSPEIKLQIGSYTAEDVDWIANAGGPEIERTGFNIYLLNNSDEENGITFDPQFEAISVGFDIAEPDEEPLFDVKGYTLQGAKLRGYFSSLDKEDDEGNAYSNWGVAAALDNVALPLGPSAEGTGVPQTLLASGDKKEEEGDKKTAVNPAFSLLVAYQSEFYLQLYDEDGNEQEILSIPLQKSFGPVLVNDVGIGWQGDGERLLFQLSGGLNLNVLKLDLDKLTVGVPVTDPGNTSEYTFDLAGFDLSFKSGPVSMAGGFLKDDSTTPQYNGAVAIQAASWGITAMGSFGTVDNSPSLFIFGVLNAALGGPPVFFVTALAAGFGYNRKVIMPAISEVQNFPFVKAAVNPELFAGKDNDKVLKSMSKIIPPELGQYWFAAGVKFTSFELLHSFALLVLQFGKKFEVDVLGVSTLQLPKAADPKQTYVNAQMALKATLEPEEGLLAVQAQLADSSYVIHPKCKITGGFAYYSWFKGDHADDFVVTLGGYNKNFDKAAHPHYPTVPRLAFNWVVSSSINFSGEAYFALTPSCVMAGGKMALTYKDGDLQAWFKAVADFLISWKPFHYDIGIGITVGVSYRVNIAFIHKTITLELGVDVQMWGPEFGGEAQVRLWIISFTVGFGVGKDTGETTVDWQKFYDYFLVGKDEPKSQLQTPAAEPQIGKTRQIISINTNAGLKSKIGSGANEVWVVDPGTFVFNTTSVFGVSKITFTPDAEGHKHADIKSDTMFGAKPIGNIVFKDDMSKFNVGIKKVDDPTGICNLADWVAVANRQASPEAMYGTVKDNKETPDAKLVKDVMKGLASMTPPATAETGPKKFQAQKLAYSKTDQEKYPLSAAERIKVVTLSASGSLDQIKNISAKKDQRDDIFTALRQVGTLATQNAAMTEMAKEPGNIFQGSPMLADEKAQATPLQATERIVTGARTTLRRSAVLTAGHQLKATIIKYGFGNTVQKGVVMRGGLYNTAESKSRYMPGNSVNIFDITPGMLQVWQLDNAAGAEHLRHSGQFPVRMVLFDEHLQVITDKVLPVTSANTETIPANASRMCLQGMSSPGIDIAGWHEESSLALVNSKYLMGNACLIRPKRSHSVGYKQYIHDTGLVKGRALVMRNISRVAGEQPGWIETRFLSSIKQVFVLLKPQADTTIGSPELDSEVRLIYTDEDGNKTAMVLTPELSGINGGETWAAFTMPDAVAVKHFSIWVEARSASGMELAGVAGITHSVQDWNAGLSTRLKTNDAVLTPRNAKNKLSVGLQNALNF
jgi:hypothetical protein